MSGRRIGSLWAFGRAIVISGAIVVVGATVLGPVVAHDNGTTVAPVGPHQGNARGRDDQRRHQSSPLDEAQGRAVVDRRWRRQHWRGGVRAQAGLWRLLRRHRKNSATRGSSLRHRSGDQADQAGRHDRVLGRPKALSKRIADTGQICDNFCTEGSLALTTGTWAITAKITISQVEGGERLYAYCELHAGGLVDSATTQVFGDAFYTSDTLPMQLLATYTQTPTRQLTAATATSAARPATTCRSWQFTSALALVAATRAWSRARQDLRNELRVADEEPGVRLASMDPAGSRGSSRMTPRPRRPKHRAG